MSGRGFVKSTIADMVRRFEFALSGMTFRSLWPLQRSVLGSKLRSKKASTGAGQLAFVHPMLPTLVAKPPEEEGWIREVKFDG
jgi:ATP-dependent DNA ligase